MSELKAVHVVDVYDEYSADPYKEAQVYLKSEADKVIAEKDAEIERLKAIRKVHVEAIESMGAGLLQDEEELRHQKYKRCLAMARLCQWKMGVFIYKKEKNEFYYRWYNRWLTLADKYKEGNV